MTGFSLGSQWIAYLHGESGDALFRRADGSAYAKVATGSGVALLDDERRRTAWLSAFELGSPSVLDWQVSDDVACLVTSAVPGVPADQLEVSALIKAWPSIVAQVRDLHAIPARDCPFDRGLQTMFDRAADVVARKSVNPDFLDPDDQDTPPETLLDRLKSELPARLTQENTDRVVCHGDACLPNFMVDPETLCCTGMIDLGRLGMADRYVDFALLVGNTRETWRTTAEARAAHNRLFDLHAIANADRARLDFYLRLDPLTWA
ncbi:APH(3'') family aminoglycoside O-phosphotransferase [Rhizobium sp. PL01]|uniref:APH(3'') family aminoglycoside O-phosphotransferase n=1 Tax=Rhizobium sp. PL01 TaxID=3085631 RepID=UPI0029823216|nr:APH(3'') family aminoglycoside O-phosphotransferase [Rhizobium sp. PL01]MDW5313633.1 APH(3'') family aminoglycoside O-phosphotransferase [Rhizobium sp. PL01]